MPNPSNNYQCPRCNYLTPRRYHMLNHFEKLKTPCPDRNGLELTPEIRTYVLKNHLYVKNKTLPPIKKDTVVIEKSEPNLTLNQTIHNYNVVNSLLSNMELIEKLEVLTSYQGVRQLDFEDQLEQNFQPKLDKMDNDEFVCGYSLNHDGLLNLVDDATKMEDIKSFNLLFDKSLNKVKILSCGKWDNYLEEMGVKEVVRLLKSYFLDSYELYLVKHLHGLDLKKDRVTLKDHLNVYYKFISAFDLDAAISTQTDRTILGYNSKENNDYYLAEHYGTIYRNIKEATKISEKNKIKRTVTNIIKDNTTHNLNALNKIMFDLIKTDQDFFNLLVEKKRFPIFQTHA